MPAIIHWPVISGEKLRNQQIPPPHPEQRYASPLILNRI